MPRFTPSKYEPVRDSSPGFRTDHPDNVVLAIRQREDGTFGCPCGCMEAPLGANSVFKMGHDARMRGKLIRAHLTDTFIMVFYVAVDGTVRESGPHPAGRLAKQYGWEEAIENAVLRRDGKNREVLRRALGSRRLVRVGRWEYTGQVVAVYGADENEFLVEYVTRTGDVRRVRVPAEKAKEI